MPPAKIKCQCCKAGVQSTDKGMKCDICEEWSHAHCVKISDDEYLFLQEHQGIDWFCSPCKKTIASIMKTSPTFKDAQDKLFKEVDDIKEALRSQIDKLGKDLKSMTLQMAEVDKTLKETTERVLSTDTKIETAIEVKLVDSLATPFFSHLLWLKK